MMKHDVNVEDFRFVTRQRARVGIAKSALTSFSDFLSIIAKKSKFSTTESAAANP